MCELDEDNAPTACTTEWRTARKSHRCCACRETITARVRYHYMSGIWNGAPETFKHCARCWMLLEEIEAHNGDGAQLDLNCGELWENPPEHIAALAFALPGEIGEASPLALAGRDFSETS